MALLEITPSVPAPRLHSQIILPSNRGSVCSLAPSIAGLLRDADLAAGDLESLSVTAGPGSFTGLRVGLSTAKMLAMACDKPVVAVDTLAAVAQRFFHEQVPQLGRRVRLVTVLNAFRKQLFTASWQVDPSGIQNVRTACVVDAERWLADPWGVASRADELDELWISGPGLSVCAPPVRPSLRAAPEQLWQPLAEDVGRLGWQAYRQGRAVSAAELAPNYIRASAAEENRGRPR